MRGCSCLSLLLRLSPVLLFVVSLLAYAFEPREPIFDSHDAFEVIGGSRDWSFTENRKAFRFNIRKIHPDMKSADASPKDDDQKEHDKVKTLLLAWAEISTPALMDEYLRAEGKPSRQFESLFVTVLRNYYDSMDDRNIRERWNQMVWFCSSSEFPRSGGDASKHRPWADALGKIFEMFSDDFFRDQPPISQVQKISAFLDTDSLEELVARAFGSYREYSLSRCYL